MQDFPRYEHVFHHGVFSPDDLVHSAWCEEFRRHVHDSLAIDLSELQHPKARAIMLVCLGTSLGAESLRQIMLAKVDKILYLPPGGRDLAPPVAIRYCKEKRVLDVIGGNPAVATWRKERLWPFVGRLRNLCQSSPMYDPVKVGDALTLDPKKDECFIATPFAPELGDSFEEGATAALRGLGFAVNNPKSEYRIDKRITDKIQGMIKASKIVVANMRHSEIDGFNANVFYEMGYGQGSDKLVLPFRHISDKPDVPVDVRDRDYIPYEDALDVAMQLYWGLKPLIQNAITP